MTAGASALHRHLAGPIPAGYQFPTSKNMPG